MARELFVLQGEARDRALVWLNGKGTGVSSKTICKFFLGEQPDYSYISYPHDTGDLQRCFSLLDKVPELWPHLEQLEVLGDLEGAVFAAIVPHFQQWHADLSLNDAGENAKRIYSEMKAIIEPIEKASGRVANIGPNASMKIPRRNPSEKFTSDIMDSMAKNDRMAELFDKAAQLVIIEQKASTPFIQRHLNIGYGSAAEIIDRLEKSGIVSPANHLGQREVLVNDIDKYKKSIQIVDKIDKISKETGITPAEVLNKAKGAIGMGHNSGSTPSSVGGVSGERLVNYLERIERLEEEKTGLADDIRDIYAEAKSAGYETKIMRQIVKLRKMDSQKRQEQEELLELYKSAIGLD